MNVQHGLKQESIVNRYVEGLKHGADVQPSSAWKEWHLIKESVYKRDKGDRFIEHNKLYCQNNYSQSHILTQ